MSFGIHLFDEGGTRGFTHLLATGTRHHDHAGARIDFACGAHPPKALAEAARFRSMSRLNVSLIPGGWFDGSISAGAAVPDAPLLITYPVPVSAARGRNSFAFTFDVSKPLAATS